MKITNLSKKTILASNCLIAKNPLTRMIGLLGRKGLKSGEGLVLKPCNSIHSLFMNFPIDVLFIDRNNKVVEVIQGFKPWRFSPLYWRSHLVIELPCGIVKTSKTLPGDIVTMSSL